MYIPVCFIIFLLNEAEKTTGSKIECDNGYKYVEEFDSCLQTRAENATWENANKLCTRDGSHLVVIDTQKKQDAIGKFIGDPKKLRYIWIGLNDMEMDGNYEWIDGTPFCYAKFGPNEPNNHNNLEHCIYLWNNKELNYGWNDAQCKEKINFICQKRINKKSKKLNKTNFNAGTTQIKVCPDQWAKSNFSDSCYHVGEEIKTFYESDSYCQSIIDSQLGSFSSLLEQKFVTELLSKKHADNVWIGLNDIEEEGDYVWIDGSQLCYISLATKHPMNKNGLEDCAILSQAANQVYSLQCSLLKKPLCMKKAEALYFQRCPSGCLLVKQATGKSNEPEEECPSVSSESSSGNQICYSSLFKKSEKYFIPTIAVSSISGLLIVILVIGSFCFFLLNIKNKDNIDSAKNIESNGNKTNETSFTENYPSSTMHAGTENPTVIYEEVQYENPKNYTKNHKPYVKFNY